MTTRRSACGPAAAAWPLPDGCAGGAGRGSRRGRAAAGTWSRSKPGRPRRPAAGPRPAPVAGRRTAARAAPPTVAAARLGGARWAEPAAGGGSVAQPGDAAGTGSRGAGQPARTLAWSAPAAPAPPTWRRSPAGPRRAVRALGELLQERVCFSHDLQRRLRAGQLGLQALVAA